MVNTTDDLVNGVRNLTQGQLRSVALYGPSSHKFLFIRDDVDQSYLSEEIDAIHEEMILEDIGIGYLEKLFHAGDLVCSTHVFEKGVMMHLVGEDHYGLFISFDSAPNIPVVEVGNFAKEWKKDVDLADLVEL
jgi:hypothetical protein